MKVLITGAAGFVGSALLRQLAAGGEKELHALARRAPHRCPVEKSIHWHGRDIAHPGNLLEGISGLDVAIHLAGQTQMVRNPGPKLAAEYRLVNVEATERLARSAVAAGVRRFIFVSTIGVHGQILDRGETVTDGSPVGPREPYSWSKWEAEKRLAEIAGESGMDLVVLRPTLVAGVGVGGNLARLAGLVSRGIPLPVPKEENVRSFTVLSNLVELIELCCDHPDAAGQSFVVAEPWWPSTVQAMRLIGEGMGKQVRTVPISGERLRFFTGMLGMAALYDKMFGDMRVDASRVRSLLGWKPRESLDDTLRAVGRHFRKGRQRS